jgi:hypothetical protein
MSYNTSSTQKYTLIDDLPDLEDLENNRMEPTIRSNKIDSDITNKYIRQYHNSPIESGMYRKETVLQDEYMSPQQEYQQQYQQQQVEAPSQKKMYTLPENSPSCIDVSNHISNCPICSKLYNNDRTLYIISIVFLLVICLLLFKKILDV